MRDKWKEPCNGCGKLKECPSSTHCDKCNDEMDKPIDGNKYLLIGGSNDKCISNGNTWKESIIKWVIKNTRKTNGNLNVPPVKIYFMAAVKLGAWEKAYAQE